MEKKAVLVQFVLTTRIIVDSSMSDEDVANKALEKIKKNSEDYLIIDNLEGIYNDVEVPYDPDLDENK